MGKLDAVRIFSSTMQNRPFVTWSPTPVNGYQGARCWIGYHIQATDGEIGHVEDFFCRRPVLDVALSFCRHP